MKNLTCDIRKEGNKKKGGKKTLKQKRWSIDVIFLAISALTAVHKKHFMDFITNKFILYF